MPYLRLTWLFHDGRRFLGAASSATGGSGGPWPRACRISPSLIPPLPCERRTLPPCRSCRRRPRGLLPPPPPHAGRPLSLPLASL